jgi:hypothetical protein
LTTEASTKKQLDSSEAIEGGYCECKIGARTLGCCCHAAAVISFLSFLKYQSKLEQPAEYLNKIFTNPSTINSTQSVAQWKK